MQRFSFRTLGAVVVTLAGLTLGCGGAPEDLASSEEAVQEPVPAPQKNEGGGVQAKYLRYQCYTARAGLYSTPFGTLIGFVELGDSIDVVYTQGSWFYAYHPASGQYGYTLANQYCS